MAFKLLPIFVSGYTEKWHWFQHLGALMMSVGAILSTRRLIRIGLKGLFAGKSHFEIANIVSRSNEVETKKGCDYGHSGYYPPVPYMGLW